MYAQRIDLIRKIATTIFAVCTLGILVTSHGDAFEIAIILMLGALGSLLVIFGLCVEYLVRVIKTTRPGNTAALQFTLYEMMAATFVVASFFGLYRVLGWLTFFVAIVFVVAVACVTEAWYEKKLGGNSLPLDQSRGDRRTELD